MRCGDKYESSHPQPNQLIKDLIGRTSLKRIGEANEVADVAFFLSGGISSYITGQNIVVDGGLIWAKFYTKEQKIFVLIF